MSPLRLALTLLAASLFWCLGFFTAYASCNEWQWTLWKRAAAIDMHGTADASDLGVYLSERWTTWRFFDGPSFDFVDAKATEARRVVIAGPLAFPRWHRSAETWAWIGAGFAGAALCAGGGALLGFARVRWFPPRGVERAHAGAAAARLRAGDVCAGPVAWACLFGPLIGLACWYIGFDRAQNDRFVADSFWPRPWELMLGAAITGLLASGLAWRKSGLALIAGMNEEERRRARACRACGYHLGALAVHRCPECGEQSGRAEGGLRRRRALIPAALAIAAASGAMVFVTGAIMQPAWAVQMMWRGPAWVRYTWNWIGLRGIFFVREPHGLLRIGEVLEITSGGERVWVYSRLCTREQQGSIVDSGVVVVWLKQPPRNTTPSEPEVWMNLQSAPAVSRVSIDVGGVSFRSYFGITNRNDMADFRLTGMVDGFRRVDVAGAPPGVAAALIGETANALREKALSPYSLPDF